MPAPLFRALAIQRYVSRGFGPKSTLTAPSRNRFILISATFLAAVTLGMLWRPLPERIAIYGQLKHPQPFLQRATGHGPYCHGFNIAPRLEWLGQSVPVWLADSGIVDRVKGTTIISHSPTKHSPIHR